MSREGAPAPAIAVVGMAGRFPGADDVRRFWRNLHDGVESISFFSEEEMLRSGVTRSMLRSPRYVPARGVASGLDLFDAAFFGFTPREAELMDPQHRVFLECAWNALEDSGIDPERFEGLIGVYAGTSISTYLINNLVHVIGPLTPGSIQAALANDKDHLATRVSYKLNLRGPSVTVQTACSTSLVAIHLACQSLFTGECDLALAGGSSVTVPIEAGYEYSEGSIVSPDGHCRAFDVGANGTVGGSGVAIVVLKRLEEALEDRDTIYAVVRGSAINNDGSFKVGYTAPSVEGQAEVIAQAQGVAEVPPDTITYIETHGTATPMGDPIEVAALTKAFRVGTARTGFCALGSVKSNVGHLDAAAGATGFIKAALALRHRQIPASLHYTAPNPELDIENSPFYVNGTLKDWPEGPTPRRAGVSSFGIGGTNAHVILEEPPDEVAGAPGRPWHLLVLSARTGSALDQTAVDLADRLEESPEVDLADVAFTLQTGRRAFKRRRTIVCRNRADAVAALRAPAATTAKVADEGAPKPVVFMFPGQGSQHLDMGRGLYETEPVFRACVDRCAEALREELGLDIREVMYPSVATPDRDEASRRLTDTRIAQPALFTIQYALAQLWMEWGIRPEAMIGHSIGEVTAACVAGVFTLTDALRVVSARGRLMAEQAPGSMMAVPLSPAKIEPYLGGGISIAAVNQPDLCVVSGPTAEIDALESRLAAENLLASRLHTSHAFHSSMMEPAVAPFEALVRELSLSPPAIPFVSGVTGRRISDAEATAPAYWARHLREAVRFGDGAAELLLVADAIFLEVGAGQTLSTLLRRQPGCTSVRTVVSSMRHPRNDTDDAASLLEAVGRLWEAGVAVDWAAYHGQEQRRRVPLPGYPFQRKRYWIASDDAAGGSRRGVGKLEDPADWFYLPTWRRTVGEIASPSRRVEGCWLILGADTPVGARLAEVLAEAGGKVVSVVAGPLFHRSGEWRYSVDPGDGEGFVALLSDLSSRDLTPDFIVHAWACPGGDDTEDLAGRGADVTPLDRELYSLLFMAGAVSGVGGNHPVRFGVLTSNAQDVLGGRGLRDRGCAALGAAKVIPQEIAGASSVCVDLDAADVGYWASQDYHRVIDDIQSPSPGYAVAYRGRQRYEERFDPVRLEEERSVGLLHPGGVYLILGGLGGVGLETARLLSEVCEAKLVLVTRPAAGGPDAGESRDRAAQEVSRLEADGAEVRVIESDATDPAQLKEAFSQAEAAFGRVSGVVFAVGAAKTPTALSNSDRVDFERQVLPRLRALMALEEVTIDLDLDFCLIQSSLASVLGAVGFAGYAAAHSLMDGFVARNNARGATRWIAVNWDNWITWKDEDRASADPTEFTLTRAEGRLAMRRILSAYCDPRIVVSSGDLNRRIERWINPSSHAPESADEPTGTSRYGRPEIGEEYEPPTTDAERALVTIWGEVLGIDGVGVRDNFFELGGDSVLGIQVMAKGRAAGLSIAATQIFDHPTIAELAVAIAHTAPGVGADQGPVSGPVPLTPIQRWFFEQDFREPQHFNMPMLWEVDEVDAALLRRAIDHLVFHHDALRLRFRQDDDGWHGFSAEHSESVPLDEVDLAAETDEALGELFSAAASAFQGSLDLLEGPMVRVVVFRTGEDRSDRVLLIVHHLVVDAVSWRIFDEDLNAVYRSFAKGEEPALPPKTTSFKEWAEALEAHARSDAARGEADRWVAALPEDPGLLPVDGDPELNTIDSTESVRVELDREATDALFHEVPRAYSATVHEVLLAALGGSLAQWTGSGRVRIALEGHGRGSIVPDLDLSRTVGWFTSLYPLDLDLTGHDNSDGLVRAIKERYRSIPNGGVGFGVARYMTPEGPTSLKEMQWPQVSFLYLGQYGRGGDAPGPFLALREPMGELCNGSLVRPHLIDFVAASEAGVLTLELQYSCRVHARDRIAQLLDLCVSRLREFITSASTGQARSLIASDFPTAGLSQEALEKLLSQLDDTA